MNKRSLETTNLLSQFRGVLGEPLPEKPRSNRRSDRIEEFDDHGESPIQRRDNYSQRREQSRNDNPPQSLKKDNNKSKVPTQQESTVVVHRSASNSLRAHWLSGVGRKSAEVFAQDLRPGLDALSIDEKVLLVRNYKKCPIKNPENAQKVEEMYQKGINGLLRDNSKYGSYDAVPEARKRVLENYKKSALRVGLIGDKLAKYDSKLSWDHIGINLESQLRDLRDANLQLIPEGPDFFYSRAYFVGSTWDEALAECLGRLSVTIGALRNLQHLLDRDYLNDLSGLETYRWNKTSEDLGRRSMASWPKMSKKVSEKAASVLLDASYVLDLKFATQTKEFKLTPENSQRKDEMKSHLTNYYWMIVMTSDHFIGTKHMSRIGQQSRGLTNDTELGDAYYDAKRDLLGVIRNAKQLVFGYTQGNPRSNRDSLNRVDKDMFNSGFDEAQKILSNMGVKINAHRPSAEASYTTSNQKADYEEPKHNPVTVKDDTGFSDEEEEDTLTRTARETPINDDDESWDEV